MNEQLNSRVSLAITNRKHIIKLDKEIETSHLLEDSVQRDEYYTFQISVYSKKSDIQDILIEKTDLVSQVGKISKENIICFNEEKSNHIGETYREKININKGIIKVLWFGITIPQSQDIGHYEGKIRLKNGNQTLGEVRLSLEVMNETSINHGCDELWRQSRLFWMNSKKGLMNKVTKDYIPVKAIDHRMQILGREIILNKQGWPMKILSQYNDCVELVEEQINILNRPINFSILTAEGEVVAFENKWVMEQENESHLVWKNVIDHEKIQVKLIGTLDFDGLLHYTVDLEAKSKVSLDNTYLEIPYAKQMAKYIMGLGLEGGIAPDFYEWKWDTKKHQDQVWIGNINGGIKCQLKDETYKPPFMNVYFNQRYLNVPKAWDNDGKGGITIVKAENEYSLKAYTGSYTMEKGERRNFEFELLITPVKPIDYKKHWTTRYYHRNQEPINERERVKEAIEEKCNYVIVHHGQSVNPFINYPFIETEEFRKLVKDGHEHDVKIKTYYTIRELSNHAQEFWPWYHLGIFPKAGELEPVFWSGKKELWAQKVFGKDVIPAWEHVFDKGKYKGETCSALIVEPNSQLDNYYIEGLDWLVKNIDIDGIYIDDTSMDRHTIRRARHILDQKEGCLIDMHSWNHMSEYAGYANSALIYMNLFPYIDSLWYGEGFDYDKSPEYWMIEIAGIPYGLTGQMLQGGGNPYRGMLYGMTNRTGWGNRSALPMYQLWDEFGIVESKMYGYWSELCPVRTGNEQVLSTVFLKEDKIMIVLASWSEQVEKVKLQIDWEFIGNGFQKAEIYLPEIQGIQEETVIGKEMFIEVKPRKGCFIILEK